VFGVGFALSGLCPGTSCVAAATGRLDGLATAAGMFCGALGSGFLFPAFSAFYASTPRGALTLPAALQLPTGVVVAGIVAAALASFVVAERMERPR
jgi:hypothetical protein